MSRGPLAKINLRSLQHNLQVVRSYAKLQKIYCMVKANAYGHGMIPVAKALKNADGFGVACLQEAALLRQHQIQNPIVLLEGLFSAAEISAAAQYDLELCIHHPRQIAWMEKYQGPKKWIVWLKLNSGMNRLGLDIDKTATWINQIRQLHCISDIRLMSHFACADEIQHPLNQQQLDRFKTYSTGSAYAKSIANSAAILSLPESHFDIVRPGVMLYGVSPFGISDPKYNLKPVMRLSSKIISVHDLQRGQSVGYGATWIAAQDQRIGIVAIGYGDGYPRHAANGTPVWIEHQSVPLVGRVSMDLIAVDLQNAPNTKIDAEVVLWGEELPVEIIATHANTIAYELLCGVTSRVTFRYEN